MCRTWLTPSSHYDNDKRFSMIHIDGVDWIQENKGNYDVLMIDRSDPVGPVAKLYKKDFYNDVYEALTDDGVFVIQSGSPFYNTSTLPLPPKNTILSRQIYQGFKTRKQNILTLKFFLHHLFCLIM